MTTHPQIARVGKRDAAPAGGPRPQAPSPSTGAAPIPAAPGGGSEALPGRSPLGDKPQLAGRVAVCPADFSGDALRYDEGKLRYDLVPEDALAEYVRVLTFGASKYAPRNWELGMDWCKCYAAMRRHQVAWMSGENIDPESGIDHMAHVAWNALALVAYRLRNKGTDDRPVLNNAQQKDAGQHEPV